MLRLFANAHYDFIKWRGWAYGLTALIIIPGFALFFVHGLNYSIEFTGGTLVQVETSAVPPNCGPRRRRDHDAEIQEFGGAKVRRRARLAERRHPGYPGPPHAVTTRSPPGSARTSSRCPGRGGRPKGGTRAARKRSSPSSAPSS
jgi:hypothetical protein